MNNVNKMKLIGPVATIVIVLFVSVLLLAVTGTGSTFAIVVEGEEYGLEVKAAPEDVDVGNLSPGDTKSSYLKVFNSGEVPFNYFFEIAIVASSAGSYKGQDGKRLEDVLQMSVARNGDKLFTGSISSFEEPLDMGSLGAGDEQRLDISVEFPEDTGNEYQGAEVAINFKVRAEHDDEPAPPPGYGDDPTPPPPGEDEEILPPPEEELEVPPETPGTDIPGEEEPPIFEDIKEPEKPGIQPPGEPEESSGELEIQPKMPKTGEFSRPAIYGFGLLIILCGLFLRKKAMSRKRG